MPPLVAPLGCLAAGVLLSPWVDSRYAWIPLCVSGALAWRSPRFRAVALVLAGLLLASRDGRTKPAPIEDDGLARRIEAVLVTPPSPLGDGQVFIVDLASVDGRPVANGRARLTWFPDPYGSEALFRDLELGRGDRIRLLVRLRPPGTYRNPGVFDYARVLERQGIFWTGTVRSPRLVEVVERGWHGADRVRDWMVSRIGGHFGDPTRRALALGMVLGQRRLLPAADASRFEEAGLVHLLVASGFNLAVIAAVGTALGRLLPLGRLARSGLTLALIVGYAGLVGGEVPVVRAAIMASWLVAGRALDRGYSPGNALAGTAILLLIVDSRTIGDASFLLSFGAVAAILLLGGPLVAWTHSRLKPALESPGNVALDRHLHDRAVDLRVAMRIRSEWRGWPLAWTALPLAAAAAAAEVALITSAIQLALLPFAVESFHRVGWISLPLNVLGAVVAALVTPLGLTLTVLPGPLASPVAGVVDLMLALLDLAVRIALEIPGGTVRVPSAPPVLWLMFALGAGLLGLGLRLRRAGASALGLACALGSGLAMVRADFSPPPPRHPVLTFLDVGQGDSTLVEMPGGQTLVVDGGGVRSGALTESGGFRVGEDVVSSYLFSRRFRRLDVLVLSHAHHDHLDGLFDLIRNFRVGEVWLGPNPMTPRYREFLDLIYTRGIPIRHVRAGDTLGRFTVLHPPRAQIVGNEVRNDDSVVLGLRWAGRRALLTGDLESDLEVPDWTEVALLKVPHHGSADTALGVRAGVPVISVGRTNAFGHPAASRLPALRTDLLGAIRVDLGPRGPRVGFPGLTDGPGGSD